MKNYTKIVTLLGKFSLLAYNKIMADSYGKANAM